MYKRALLLRRALLLLLLASWYRRECRWRSAARRCILRRHARRRGQRRHARRRALRWHSRRCILRRHAWRRHSRWHGHAGGLDARRRWYHAGRRVHGHARRLDARRWLHGRIAVTGRRVHGRHAWRHAHRHHRWRNRRRSHWRHARRRAHRHCSEQCVWPRDAVRVLRGEQALGRRAMPLSFGVLLQRVRDADRLPSEELPVHRLDRQVRGLKVVVADEAIPLRAVKSVSTRVHIHRIALPKKR